MQGFIKIFGNAISLLVLNFNIFLYCDWTKIITSKIVLDYYL